MPVAMNKIVPGSSGEDVYFVKQLLSIFESCSLSEEDLYDETTQKYVISFQQKCGLPPDGIIDIPTWNRLAPTLTKEYNEWNKEKAVKLIQIFLKKLGYLYFKPDGIYGTGTRVAVEAFQSANGLKADGVWGKSCWNAWFLYTCQKYQTPALSLMNEAVSFL